MNCRRAERLRSLGRDHPISERAQSALETHLAHCPTCHQREESYRRLVAQCHAMSETVPRRDLLAHALLQTESVRSRIVTPLPDRLRLQALFKRKRSLLRGFAVTAIALMVLGTMLVEMPPRMALGQSAIQKMREAVGRAKTTHIVSWQFLPNEEEARNHTWHDGKKPFRFETWLTQNAMSGQDELNGPYLWSAKGYLHYDRSAGQVEYMNLGTEQSLTDAIKSSSNPLTEIQRAVSPGTYLSVKRLGDAQWRGKRVYKLEIASGPKKPARGEEISLVQEPGKTPPVGLTPQLRQTFWVDKATDLPVYSEYEKQIQHRWVVTAQNEYDYNRPAPSRVFDPEAVRKAAEAFFAARKTR